MPVFKIETDYNMEGNSPWDAIWYEGDYRDLEALGTEVRLAPIWKAPLVNLEKRDQTPDLFVFLFHYAITDRVRDIIAPLLNEYVEFLPLAGTNMSLFVLHPLFRAEFDKRAVFSCNPGSGNITVIKKYSFLPLPNLFPIFQVRQAHGSENRDAGIACADILVSAVFKELVEKHHLKGIVLSEVV